MRGLFLALTIGLSATAGFTAEIVVLSDGSRMEVLSYEVQGNVVVITALDGGLRSLPLVYIDLEATRSSGASKPAGPALPEGREERLRWALEHYGGKPLLGAFVRGLVESFQASREMLPERLRDGLIRGVEATFDADAIFRRVSEQFLLEVNAETEDAWFRWLETPIARELMALEQAAAARDTEPGAGFLDGVEISPIPASRRRLIVRLDESTRLIDTLYQMYVGAVDAMATSLERNATPTLGKLLGGLQAARFPDLTPEVKDAFIIYLHRVYLPASDPELERYVRFWESANGQLVTRARMSASIAGFRAAGDAAGQAVANLYADYFPAPAPNEEASQQTAEARAFDALNFEYTPPAGWAPLEVSRWSKDAQVGFLRSDPLVVFMIVAEDGGTDLRELTSEQGAALVRANLESKAKHYQLLSEKSHSVGGMDGVLMTSDAEFANRELYYVHWVYVHNGYFYQLAAWGEKGSHDTESVETYADQAFSGFRILDPARRSVTPATVVSADLATDYRSEVHGYSMSLEGTSWSVWSDLDQTMSEADFGGLYRDTAAFVVVPVHLGELEPSMEHLSNMLLSRVDITWSAVGAAERRRIGDGDVQGYDIDWERKVGETPYVYRIRVWRRRDKGYMVASWIRKGEDTALLEDLLARFVPDDRRTEARDLTEIELQWQGTFVNDIGILYYEEGQYARSVPFLEVGAVRSPADPFILENLVSALAATGRFEDGLKWIDERGHRFPDSTSVHSYRPFFLAKLGRYEDAAREYGALFETGYQNDEDLWDYAEVLWELQKTQEAIDVVSDYRRDRESVLAARLQALLYRRTEDYERAIALLEEKRRAFPSDASLVRALLETHYEAGRHESSIELAEKLIAKGGDWPREEILFLKGRAELALNRYAEAKTSFQAALDLDPRNADVREYLDYVSGLLGQGDHEAARHPVEAVAIPPSLEAPAQPSSADTFDDYGAYYPNRVTAISFRTGEEYRRTERYVVRLTDSKAVSTFSSWEFPFSPLSERVYVNELRVLDGNGKTVATGEVSTFYVTDDTSDEMATGDKILNVPVAGLEPGRTLELTITWERTSPPDKMPFVRHTFSSGYPTLRSTLYISGTVDGLRYRSANLDPTAFSEGSLSWTVEDPPLYRLETLSDSAERYLPFVWVGGATESWEELARSYLEQIKDRLELDEETKALAHSLVEGLSTSEARVEALSKYVQDSFTYKAIEFGQRARVPNFAMEIVANRYGDCKDHSLLFYQLLRAVDEPALLVLVSTANEIHTDVPSLDQFNHMIVYSSRYRGGHFFDLTDKNHDVSALPPMGLAGTQGLLLDPAEPRLVELPDYPESSNRVVSRRKLEVDGSADLVVEETLRLDGYYGAWLRSALKSSDSATQRQQVQRYMRSGGQAVVEEVSTENLSDPRQPLVLRVRYRLPGVLQTAEQKLVGKLPAIWERTLLDVTPTEERRTPYRLEYPVRVESDVTVMVPDGYRIASAPRDDETAGPLAEWVVKSAETGPVLVLQSRAFRRSGRGSAAEFPELVSTMSSFLSTLEGSFVLEKTN